MVWLEYNIHMREGFSFEIVASVLVGVLKPFVDSNRGNFNHWHYLIERDRCRDSFCEIRVRFEGEEQKLLQIKSDLVAELQNKNGAYPVMTEAEASGSHVGRHGERNRTYEGAAAEDWTVGRDWEKIVEILQIGSDSALKILQLGIDLEERKSLQPYLRHVNHRYFLHLPTNQLIVEP